MIEAIDAHIAVNAVIGLPVLLEVVALLAIPYRAVGV